MKPVMIHEDGTDCAHEGKPQAVIQDEGGPLCPGGCPVTHIRFNGHVMTMAEATAAFHSVARTFTAALTPLITACAEFARKLSTDPAIRALAAAAAVVSEERARLEE